MRSITGHAPLPPWVWPLSLVVVVVVLATVGRYLVAGMFAVIAVAFVLALVSALVWGLLAMASPGPRGALHDLSRSPGEARARAREARPSVVHRVGQAPWRSPQRVVNLVANQLAGEVLELPSGRVAYRHLRVRMHPETLQLLDGWMPIQEVAAIWAEHYIDTQSATRGMEASVTISVSGSEELPRGRALLEGAVRAHPDGPDTRARAQYSRGKRNGQQVAERGRVVRLRADHPQGQRSATDTHEVYGQATPPDPEATMRFAAARARPAGNPGAAHSAAERAQRLRDQTTQLDRDATVGLAPGDAGEATQRHAPVRLVLGFRQVAPATHRALGNAPEFFDNPRVCIGRDPGMDLSLDDPNVSREHAEVRRVNDQWTITDSSKNGTTLNGTPLTPGKRYPIRDGDIIAFDRNPGAGTPTYRVLLTTDAQGTARP